jgi:hypothetical protein
VLFRLSVSGGLIESRVRALRDFLILSLILSSLRCQGLSEVESKLEFCVACLQIFDCFVESLAGVGRASMSTLTIDFLIESWW